jgi:hypothetical protein
MCIPLISKIIFSLTIFFYSSICIVSADPFIFDEPLFIIEFYFARGKNLSSFFL